MVFRMVLISAYVCFMAAMVAEGASSYGTFYHKGATTDIKINKLKQAYSKLHRGGTLYWNLEDSPGGSYYHGMQVIKIIKANKKRGVRTVFRTKKWCASMCTLLVSQSAAKSPRFSGRFLFHTLQMRVGYFTVPLTSGPVYTRFISNWGYYYRTILTKKQYKALTEGKDILISRQQMNKRFKHWTSRRIDK